MDKLQHRKFWFGIHKRLCVIKQWNWFLREIADPPTLEIIRTQLHVNLSDLI